MRRVLRRIRAIAPVILGLFLCATAAKADSPAILQVVKEGRQPQVAVDPLGRIHVVYGLENEVRYVVSTDGGRTFSSPIVVEKLPKLALGMRRGPRIAASAEAVVITAVSMTGEIDKGKYKIYSDGTLLAWRSTDAGRTWAPATPVNSVKGSAAEGLHALTVGPDGTFFTAWNDNRSRAMEVYGARSRDGRVWTDETLVYRSPEGPICPCCHPSASFAPDGTLFVMWRNQLLGHRDLFLTQSNDGGKSYGDAIKLGQGTWSFNACPMDGGAIAAASRDSVETVWMREARTFAARPGSAERSLGRGVQPWGTASADGAYFVWLSARPGKLFVLRPGDNRPTVLTENANDPVVASPIKGRGPTVAVWEATAPGGTSPAAHTASSTGHGNSGASVGAIGMAILSGPDSRVKE